MPDVDTGTTDLTASIDKGVAVLTMSRPERRNALTAAMLGALGRLLPELAADPEVRCLVLTGAGGAFCAGGDVKGFASGAGLDGSVEERVAGQRRAHRAVGLGLYEFPKPTVALLPGAAAGAGLSLALACDLRYAVDTAVLTTAFGKVALPGDFGGAWLMTQLVGAAKTRELFYRSPRLSAAEALRVGLLTDVFPAAEFEASAHAVVAELAAGPAAALAYMKDNVIRATRNDLADYLDTEATYQIRCRDTADHHEAVAAFVEKRLPRFG